MPKRQCPSDSQHPKPKRMRGKRGLLQNVLGAPLDIVFEILSHLEPLDILRLSRTSKDLRSLLRQKSSSFVWQAARRNIEMPAPPSDLPEPRFASLVFDTDCHNCPNRHGHYLVWQCAIRYCRACFHKFFSSHVPFDNDLYKFITEPQQVQDISSWAWISQDHSFQLQYHLPTVTDLVYDYVHCASAGEDGAKWFEAKRREFAERKAHSHLCQEWVLERQTLQAAERHQIKQKRQEEIKARLTREGWHEIDTLDFGQRRKFMKLRAVNQAKALTDKIWSNILPQLAKFMQPIRDARQQAADAKAKTLAFGRYEVLATFYKSFASQQPLGTITPSISELHRIGALKELLEAPTSPSSVRFLELWFNISTITEHWQKETEAKLVAMLPNRRRETLQLASTVFRCQWAGCNEPLVYPSVLTHSCSPRDCSTSSENSIFKALGSQPLHVMYDYVTSITAWTTILACGMNPNTATSEEVLALDPILECVPSGDPSSRLFMRWSRALNHKGGVFSRCIDQDIGDIVRREERYDGSGTRACTSCEVMNFMDSVSLVQHMLMFHCVTSDKIQPTHYVQNPDDSVNQRSPRPVYLNSLTFCAMHDLDCQASV